MYRQMTLALVTATLSYSGFFLAGFRASVTSEDSQAVSQSEKTLGLPVTVMEQLPDACTAVDFADSDKTIGCSSCHQQETQLGNIQVLPPAVGHGTDAGRLGVLVEPLPDVLRRHLRTPHDSGLLITHVVPDSPADRDGLQPHDILLQLDNQWLYSTEQMRRYVRSLTKAETVRALLMRDGEQTERTLTPEVIQLPTGNPHSGYLSGIHMTDARFQNCNQCHVETGR